MNDRRAFTIVNERVRANCIAVISALPLMHRVTIREAKRTDTQNNKMWAMLGDVSKQVIWRGQKQTPDEWKDMMTAFLKKQRFVSEIGQDGMPGTGLIVLGARTRDYSIADMSLLIEALNWFGALHGVRWGESDQNHF